MATIATSPLPTLDSPRIKELGWTAESDHYNVYETVLQAEAHTLQFLDQPWAKGVPAIQEMEGKLIAVRVAGYLLLEFETQSDLFGITPSAALVKWFTSLPESPQSNQHDVIIDYGTLLRDNFIQLFRTSNVQYPLSSSNSSRSLFDTLEDMTKDSMESTGDNYAAVRRKVLARDGYRCAVTGVYDDSSLESCTELRDLSEVAAVRLGTAHILHESASMQGSDPAANRDSEDIQSYNKTCCAARAMSILKSFGFPKFPDALTSGGIHQVWNLISLVYNVHTQFKHLNMWFEYTSKPHCYKVCTSHIIYRNTIYRFAGRNYQVDDPPMFAEFNSTYEEAPPPDPLLLALHATCARVAHMSGAAEFFDRVGQSAEETNVLALDGSSGPLLNHLLSAFATIPGYIVE